ncbi:MAG: 4-alpha-glucanotransferase [Caldisphaera sp.]|nr:MAG: 4-alpha-glucanotransferase [Caldisphaera sp.]PMP91422.1 MAG: 4-alpha-glucanotransferase [Caldisphaera sp.]
MNRGSGVLLPIFSLPGNCGIGDFGKYAYQFIDFLYDTGQMYWQVLPMNPIDPIYDNSPYSPLSSFAGNPLFISIEGLISDGYLSKNESCYTNEGNYIDYNNVKQLKYNFFRKAFSNFRPKNDYYRFLEENKYWIEDFSLFISIRDYFNKPLMLWPREVKIREKESIRELENKLKNEIEFNKFLQYQFFRQWFNLKRYANKRKISIIGDLPIYVNHDSGDVWSHPNIFKLDDNLNPRFVSGVPPDYFSKYGQLWNTPVFDWNQLRKDNFLWWIKRYNHLMKIFDYIRLDHFRGYSAYWEVPYGEKTAVNGKWIKAYGFELFFQLKRLRSDLRIIAEDLGYITQDVKNLRNYYSFPGMKVLQFAFDGNPKNEYKPHNYDSTNYFVYTATHDNNTSIGWYQNEATKKTKIDFIKYTRINNIKEVNWAFIRLALGSIAKTSIIPIQDILGLGSSARINTPGTTGNNWRWKLTNLYIPRYVKSRLYDLTKIYGRI